MDFAAFEALLRELCAEIPDDYFDGVTEVTASPRAVPHPDRPGIFTLGECIPLPLADGDPQSVQSRVVLYHGSFRALAEGEPTFDWAGEAWDTLTHELRHHVEWRAQVVALEGVDRAVEANFARHDGDAFDPLFYRDGIPHGTGVFEVGDDWFVERIVTALPRELRLPWRGRTWRVAIPAAATLPAYLSLTGVADPPPGELILVVRSRPRWRDLLRPAARPSSVTVPVQPLIPED